jgi:translation initiation factor 4E
MTTPDALPAPKPERPGAPPRLPSLNQLAARINAAPSAGVAPVARPRLAAALLRTNSTASVASAGADSLAVHAPGSRAATPTLGGVPTPAGTPGPAPAGGEPLTAANVHALDTGAPAPDAAPAEKEKEKADKPIRGYKNIPSLDAITARLAKARTLSVDGSAQPPEPESIPHPQTPGIRIAAPEHPLEHSWCVPMML